ncbi:MAG: leucine-rich repeat domain-containing protein [Bacteroidaceae bacterium]|nr:leucine-rich repeat domain-containing protein [Bacteroidaceae bacterium]
MKKTFKLMLAFALVALGSTSAWAVKANGDTFAYGYYNYQVQADPDASNNLKVAITGIRAGYESNVNVAGELSIPTTFDMPDLDITYHVSVTGFATTTFQNLTNVTSVSIPATFTEIPANAFMGCTNITSITFAAGSQVRTIGANAFGTTRITNFDFSPCVKLAELVDETFVEPGESNSFITTITLPSQPYFKHINGAFKNLTNLATLNGLENTYVTEIINNAFTGTKLKSISLPATVKYIASNALGGTTVESLTINVRDLEYLGGGSVGASPAYTWTSAAAVNNLFAAATNTTLKSLSLTGTLKGQISANAFLGCTALQTATGLSGALDLTTVTFGSKATIEGSAFEGCTGITSLTIGDIANNETGAFTIQGDAFKDCTGLTAVTIGNISTADAVEDGAFAGCTNLATVILGNISATGAIDGDAFVADKANYTDATKNKLASVTIGDLTATGAIGAASFGKLLKDVTIGSVVANGTVIPAGAFVWAKISAATLNLASATGKYLSQSSADPASPAIAAGAFDMSAITGLLATEVYPVITIGEIRSKGGAFAADAITSPASINTLTFAGDIAANGIDVELLSAAALTAITFNGKIGAAGLATGSFANQVNIATFNFAGELAAGAVAAGAFDASGLAAATINYTCADVDDYTVNPFDNNAFSATATDATARFMSLNVTDADLLAEFKDDVYGIGANDATRTSDAFDIFLVTFPTTPITPPAMTFPAYVGKNASSVAWARYDDFGAWTVDINTDYDVTDLGPLTNGPKVQRYQTIDGTKVKVTLYGVYTDEDDNAKLSTVYMVPLKVTAGYYEVSATNAKTIIAKVESRGDAFAAGTTLHVPFTDAYVVANNSVWTDLPANEFTYSIKVHTHQQLWDAVAGYEDIWNGLAIGATNALAPYALFVMNNPASANFTGFDISRITFTEGNAAYLGNGWYYTILKSYDKKENTAEASARIVWLDDDEATAIFGVKEEAVKTAADKFNGAIYNLQGVRVDESYKGIVIKNGKKYLQK